jgi:hypothetical protein
VKLLRYLYGVFIFLLTLPALLIGYFYGNMKFAFGMGYKASIAGQQEADRINEMMEMLRAVAPPDIKRPEGTKLQ